MKDHVHNKTTQVVIVGAGFGGLNAAKKLNVSGVAVTLIDQFNYHLFQPLLYQVATAGLSPADISVPVRQVLSKQQNCQVMLAKVKGVDLIKQQLETETAKIPFDYLF